LSKFKLKQSLGNIAEYYILEKFKDFGPTELYNKIGHDIRVEWEPTFTIEVKYDHMSNRTGNIAIEYRNSRKNTDSGILASQADLWVYYLNPDEVYIISLAKLKEFCHNTAPFKTLTKIGDGNADIYLYKKGDILKEFTNISGISSENLKTLTLSLLSG
jgi:hypothetical protein